MDPVGEFLFEIVCISLFLVTNRDKHNIYLLSGFLVALFFSQCLYLEGASVLGKIFYVIAALGLVVSYFLRTKHRRKVNFLKWICLFLLLVYPVQFFELLKIPSARWMYVLSGMTFPCLITVYVYDQWIINSPPMKKRFVFILAGQSLLILVLLLFSLIQKSQADSAKEALLSSEKEVQEMRIKCQ